MFSAFGSMLNDDMENGLIENFQNESTTKSTSECVPYKGINYCPTPPSKCTKDEMVKLEETWHCPEKSDGYDEDTSDEEEAEFKNEEEEDLFVF